ncbi:ORF6N domain-containing protein [Flavobacterium sp. ANB]|uniref:ORF6N domain-containing protein n=1 Tax=unclassified Flavobacterium TaxID=196869 RepID=UPI0012B8C6E4|nr:MULTISPECIES: ORF6N domain-containing protein [unclassified Flavobacterium]MBF4515301.1 ORF6N domain-containing protein [Flavobacterium sp. ANB]MTD70213.1 ORF6N domain-containing protein [Flavobacterium sp. LC2016-13]
MDDQSLLSEEAISTKIYFIRGQKVMLDRDLAILYGIETKRLKEQVKRNRIRFPEDFMFELTKIEFENWRSQIATSNSEKMGLRYVPMAFTEHGVLMLSSVLNSDKAIQTNIQIMRIFTKVRQMLLDTTEIKVDIQHPEASGQKKLENHDKNIELVFSYLDELTEKKENEVERVKIGYKK